MTRVDECPRILFLCTGNACRSQMAEGWARSLHGGRLQAWSAGIAPHGLDPRAVAVMIEAGVDISGQRAKALDELDGASFDWIVTVCDRARESCPVLPGSVRSLHVAFEDPPRLVSPGASEQQALVVYRRVRDEIREFVESLPARLTTAAADGSPVFD